MTENLSGKSFLKLLDFTSEEIMYLINLAAELKEQKRAGIPHRHLEGKNIVLLFQKTSTRTRCSFEVGAFDLGMNVTYLDPASSQMSTKESIADTARVLGRFYDGIEFRGFAHSDVEELARYAGVPVWNGLTNEWHPTQMIADMLTIKEHFGTLAGKRLVFMGDAKNNVARSLMVACAKLGMDFVACGPTSCMPAADVLEAATSIATENACTIELTSNPAQAMRNADIIYTDVWVSMGESADVWEQRIADLRPYQVTRELLSHASEEAIFLHCLPAFHDTKTEIGAQIAQQFGIEEMEVTNEVFESDASLVFEQAENRMHAIKAIMYATLK